MSTQPRQTGRTACGIGIAVVVLVVAGILFVVEVVVPVAAGVASVRGLLYSFGLGSAEGLAFPAAVRTVTLVLVVELAVGVGIVLDFRDGRRHLEWRWAWAVAHGTIFRRLYRRGRWLGRIGLQRLMDGTEDYLMPLARWLWASVQPRLTAVRARFAATAAVELEPLTAHVDDLPEPVMLTLRMTETRELTQRRAG